MIDLPHVLEQVKAGNKSAFKQIYVNYSPKIYRFAKRYTSQKEDAEEIVQDVFGGDLKSMLF